MALVVLLLAAPAAATAAGKQLSLDPDGHRPRVAVNNVGTGHFTWTTPEPTGFNDVFHYCRVAQGAQACNASKTYAPGSSDLDGGYTLFASGGRMLLLDARCCDPSYALKEVFSSANGGTTFTGPVSPGHMDGSGDNIIGQAIYAPAGSVGRAGESILTVSNVQTEGVTFQATGTGAGSEAATAKLGGPGGSYQGSVALRAPSTLVAIYGTLGPDRLYWRRWNGSGDVNSVTNWSPPVLLDSTNVFSTGKLVSGPSGIYVAYSRGATSKRSYLLRKFTGAGWGPATVLTEVGNPSSADLVEDGAGRLHFAWQDSSGKLRYRYARSGANTQFTSAQTLAPTGSFPFLKLGVNSAGRGWATWESIPGIHAVPVAPGEPPYAGPSKATRETFGSHELVLHSPKNCVGKGQAFVASVSGDVTIKKAVFSIDGKQRAVVKAKPFRATLGTKTLGSGLHHVKAVVTASFKKNGQTKTVTKDLAAGFSIC
ncbi:MAG TPA: hypothetical protein VJT75_04320 [Thermoleophilaceae bacterium]|nr:hypothetical protein [Thermoleophilaceae bacterium]